MKNIDKLSNGDLKFNIEKILDNQKSVEEENQKIGVGKEYFYELDYPFIIYIQDASYFYTEQEERDKDYDILCKILKNNSNKFYY